MATATEFLHDIWYMAIPGKALKCGKTLAKRILNQPILLGRSKAGEAFALRNICPHRGVPLSYGRFDGCEVECCYHGWRFDTKGQCTRIPSLVANQSLSPTRVKVMDYPCREVQGNIWIYISKIGQPLPSQLPEIPQIPGFSNQCHHIVESKIFPCDIDHAVIGLMDPAHGPFVHRQWWWRSAKSIHPKAKQFAPTNLGFTMSKHKPSNNSRAYKILGKNRSTEITFTLPGIRIEDIKAGNRRVVGLTTLTPITANETQIHQMFYWNMPWLLPAKPMIRKLARKFLEQDYGMVAKQQEGLLDNPSLMLIKDADTLARWYFKLKKEYLLSQQENRPFNNPVPETTLHWCS